MIALNADVEGSRFASVLPPLGLPAQAE